DEKPGNAPPALEKKDECVGSDIPNIEEVLGKSACEEPSARADGLAPVDLKGKLQVTAAPSPTKVAPGERTDVLVTFANMSKEPPTLPFRVDPLPRFEVETYDEKNKRVDMPAGKPPPPAKGQTPPPASEAKVAKITISPGGNARAHVPWTGVKM